MSYYVSGCKDNGSETVTCDDSEAQFWTLYVRDDAGLSQGIIDLAFREDAEAAMAVYVERDALQEQVRALAAENTALKSGIGFFSYGTDSGYEEHSTADDAIKAADSDIDYYRGEACDGWPDETDQAVWGIVMQRASMVGLRTETDNNGREKQICDYALLPPVEIPATDAALREIRALVADGLATEFGLIAQSLKPNSVAYRAAKSAVFKCVGAAARIRAGEQP